MLRHLSSSKEGLSKYKAVTEVGVGKTSELITEQTVVHCRNVPQIVIMNTSLVTQPASTP